MSFKLPSIEELVVQQLEEIERLKKAIKSETSQSTIMILKRKLADAEKSLKGHKGRVREVKIKKLLDLGDKELMKKIKKYSNMPNFRQNSIVGRYLDGTPFYSFWYRLMCIDDSDREWGQVYFALNPDEAKNKECLNKHLRNESIDKLLK